ncbi:glycosyltransferase [Paraflavitalea speifideaquila]|uniref:glycosyltransferase n=1 Tax=Paraflavitalea speifideaquila TaxID=3076558 RepID=UPI0028E75FF9|nr:glycosyltransferase [Paraflavitalea speifideiaquila]
MTRIDTDDPLCDEWGFTLFPFQPFHLLAACITFAIVMSHSPKIRILETIRQGQIGGGESHLLSLVENLDKDRYEPVVLSFTEGPMVDRLKAMGIQTEVIYTEKPFDISKWKRVKAFIEANNIQLVHAHGTRANSNVFWATKNYSCRWYTPSMAGHSMTTRTR